jgi:selenoprotein W-related protein
LEAAFKLECADDISEIDLIESAGGAFEIRVDGDLIYSKLETGRHPDPPEILNLFRDHIKEQ